MLLEPVLTVNLACYHRQKSNMAWRETRRQLELQCSYEAIGVENACIPFHIFHTLSTSSAIISPMVFSGCFHKTKANMVFFGDHDTLIHTDSKEFRAGIWPMGKALAVAAFELLLVGCVLDLKGAVAGIRDFISTSIQFISRSKVASSCFFSLHSSRDQTFRSSEHFLVDYRKHVTIVHVILTSDLPRNVETSFNWVS